MLMSTLGSLGSVSLLVLTTVLIMATGGGRAVRIGLAVLLLSWLTGRGGILARLSLAMLRLTMLSLTMLRLAVRGLAVLALRRAIRRRRRERIVLRNIWWVRAE